jgi:hypothetical protein
MAGERFGLSSRDGSSDGIYAPPVTPVDTLLNITHFNYPWILLVIFLAAFVAHSVLTADPTSESIEPVVTGPGGKPLPRSTKKAKEAKERRKKLKDFSPGRKLVFIWLSAGVITTFVANAVNIVVHALTQRDDGGWWCGEGTAVSGH